MLSVGDPAPFEIVNRNGAAPLLIACDHASNLIPSELDNLGLGVTDLSKHIGYDIGARQVALHLSRLFDAPLISANYSRLVIDLNRHLGDASLIVEDSDGVPIPGNRRLSGEQKQQRIDCLFLPYHHAYQDLLAEIRSRHRSPIILSVHSFTPSMNGRHRPWHYGVLWDVAHESLACQIINNFKNFDHILVGENEPYHANDPQGYAQVMHAENNNLEMALIEIRQDIVECASDQKAAANTLYQVLSPTLPTSNP